LVVDRIDEAAQYYGIAAMTVFFCEYFATLPDEVIVLILSDPSQLSELTPLL